MPDNHPHESMIVVNRLRSPRIAPTFGQWSKGQNALYRYFANDPVLTFSLCDWHVYILFRKLY